MFDWFIKKKVEPVVFADNHAAFEHACSMNYRVLLEAVIPALVEEQGRQGEEGERYFRLKLPLDGGTMELWGCTLKESDDYPEPGDLVGFQIVRIASDLPPEMSIIGFIAFKLEPVLSGRGWKIAKNYTPRNIKPTIRF